MSSYGNSILKYFEDPEYKPNLSTIKALRISVDADDSKTIDKVLESLKLTKET